MELNFFKFKFLVIILCSVFQMPGGSEAASMDHDSCGQSVVNDSGPGHYSAVRVMPWVVGITATVGNETRACSGSIVAEHLVVTSKYCAPKEPELATYVIDYDFGRQEPVTTVYLVKQSPFIVLGVKSPFRLDFTVCLALKFNTTQLNDTVWSASWIIGHPGAIKEGALHQEQWTLAKGPCNITCKTAPTDRCTCAIATVDKWTDCHGNEGKAVMRWNGKKWYLVGMVTETHYKGSQCPSSPERLYRAIYTEDAIRIAVLNEPGLMGPPEEDSKASLQKKTCGRADYVHLGPQKVVAPIFLPWVVAVRATLGTRTLECAGAIIGHDRVLTVAQCYPEAFRNATYKVIHGSMDLSTGTETAVEDVITDTELGPSFALLFLASSMEHERRICMTVAPYNLKGNDVVAASWAFNEAEKGLKKNMLSYEKWRLPVNRKVCEGEPFAHRGPLGEHMICAVAGTATGYACQGHLGQVVMRWEDGQWFLIGMVTNVDVGPQDCKLRESRKRIFEWISRWEWEEEIPRSITEE